MSTKEMADKPQSTQPPPSELIEEFRALFAAGKEEFFEDGMETDFSRRLLELVDNYGDAAIEVLTLLILGERVNPEVASEALRWIGRHEDPLTYRARRRLLEASLRSSSARVRDGALLGIASMDDPRSIPAIKRAIEREQNRQIRRNLEQVLQQLAETLTESTA